MAKPLKKGMLYGLLLIAGVTFGMQMAEPGSEVNGWVQNGGMTAGGGGGQPGAAGWPQGTWPQSSGYNGNTQVPGYGNTSAGSGGNYGAGAGTLPGGTGSSMPAAGGIQGTQAGDRVLETPADLLLPAPEAPAVDRFADKAAHLLQQVSRKSIHWFASWFGPSPE
ncbi:MULTISPECIES: hypothetical protein [Paenibacillus]|uniref:hypothetical protein n=1 Tax=Paenibacillus TaxID=44249 RepID=UPI002FE0A004